jgi:hypothetical protein
MDTREPFGIRDAVPEAQALLTSLLQSSGIVNMASAFSSLNNYTGITSPLVKRGIGGTSSWNSALVKAESSNYAKKANEEIAKNESKKLAYVVRLSADEAIKGLADGVNTANQNVRDKMDNIFIFKGLWSKIGNNYVKDIIKGSTVIEPVVTQTVNITGYKNYIMEPVTLQTNLDDDFLSCLDSIAIQELINNVYLEVETIAGDIFGNGEESKKIIGSKGIKNKLYEKLTGDIKKETENITEYGDERELSPGKFGTHIGYGPAGKDQEKATKNRNEMFYDEGYGEMGRLMSDFQYWYAIDKMGSSELAIAPWDKRIWNDEGSWFSAPSIRTVGIIAGTVAAAVVTTAGTLGAGAPAGIAGIAVSIALCSTSEVALGALDAVFDYKAVNEVAFSVGKTILTNTVTSVIGGVFNGIADTGFKGLTNIAMGKVSDPFAQVLTKTLMTGTQTFTSGVTSNLISGITYTGANGFGYSEEIFKKSMKGTLNSTITSMASTFVSSGLTAINSGLDNSKIEGFNKLNKDDIQNYNVLIGSIDGQGVNYALGNDFTLNVLNLSLFTDSKYNSGLLELHLGQDGINMSIGTGGANVSVDNLVSAFEGAKVWNVNTKISKYGKEKNFDALIALRLQYGYGDDRQKEQFWDILNGEVLINTKAKGDYFAETTINEDGKRVINLTGYKEDMSRDEQYLLGVVLGYESYRDGYTIGQTDAFGDKVTYEAQSKEFQNAQIAKLLMGDRIQAENNWFYEKFEGLAIESSLLKIAQLTNNMSLFNDYMEYTYDNSKDYLCISAATNGDYQNNYKKELLFGSLDKILDNEKIENINAQRLQAAFERYNAKKNLTGDEQESQKLYNDFINNKKLQADYGYYEMSTTTISDAGCMFMSTKYLIEAITKKEINTLELHQFIKDKKLYIGDNMLSKFRIADIINKYTNNEYNVEYNEALSNKLMNLCEKIDLMKNITNENVTFEREKIERQLIETLNKIESPDEKYVIHLRIKEPGNKNAIVHSVAVSSIDYTYDKAGNITGIKQVNVANPFLSSTHFNGKISYLPNQIDRWDVYKVKK